MYQIDFLLNYCCCYYSTHHSSYTHYSYCCCYKYASKRTNMNTLLLLLCVCVCVDVPGSSTIVPGICDTNKTNGGPTTNGYFFFRWLIFFFSSLLVHFCLLPLRRGGYLVSLRPQCATPQPTPHTTHNATEHIIYYRSEFTSRKGE